MIKKSSTSKKQKTLTRKNIKKTTEKKALSWKIVKPKEDKMLEKVERYVDKNREKISQEIIERRSKRPVSKYNAADLEVMISRIDSESKGKEKPKSISKCIVFLIYILIIITILVFMVKYFFTWNIPQIS